MTAVAIRLTFHDGDVEVFEIDPRKMQAITSRGTGLSGCAFDYEDFEIGTFERVTKVEYLPEEPPRT